MRLPYATETPTIIDPSATKKYLSATKKYLSATKNYLSATGSIIVGISVYMHIQLIKMHV
jgi:hypothetical protein